MTYLDPVDGGFNVRTSNKSIVSILEALSDRPAVAGVYTIPHDKMSILERALNMAKERVVSKCLVPASAWATLYLAEGAPEYVVDAVWKTLAKRNHPDVGGDAEVFKRLQEAYLRIKNGVLKQRKGGEEHK